MGPILSQVFHQVPENCTADELGAVLATKGAHLVSKFFIFKDVLLNFAMNLSNHVSDLQLLDTLATLPEVLTRKRDQQQMGATFGKYTHHGNSFTTYMGLPNPGLCFV